MSRLLSRIATVPIVIGVIAAVPVASRLTTHVPSRLRGGASAIVFLATVIALTAPVAAWRDARAEWRQATSALVSSGVAFLGCVLVATPHLCIFAAAILTEAWAEEVLFRLVLPTRLHALMTGLLEPRGAAIPVVLAQLLFAVCHFAPGSARGFRIEWIEATRIFASGILYFVLANSAGLWLATALHAWLNLNLVVGAADLVRPSSAVVCAITLFALLALWALSATSPPQFLTQENSRNTGPMEKAHVSTF